MDGAARATLGLVTVRAGMACSISPMRLTAPGDFAPEAFRANLTRALVSPWPSHIGNITKCRWSINRGSDERSSTPLDSCSHAVTAI